MHTSEHVRLIEDSYCGFETGNDWNPLPKIILLAFSAWDRFLPGIDVCRRRWPTARIYGLMTREQASDKRLRIAMDNGLCETVLLPAEQTLENPRNSGLRGTELAEWKQRYRLEGLIGESPEFVAALERIPPFAAADAPVMILGETGSGKELFARAIHYCSPRKARPFVPVNCGALPEHLFENEIFGHAKGAYTDAGSNCAGLLSVAEGGTLFLDELDSLAPSGQVKLLRFLQNHEYRALGSTRILTANVRVVAAMNGDPETLIATFRLREDLYHRVNVLRIQVPALRQRPADITTLARHFLGIFAKQNNQPVQLLTNEALIALSGYHWPGNIRELEASMHRAALLAGARIDASDLDLPGTRVEPPSGHASGGNSLRETKLRVVQSFEREYLVELLRRCKGNITRAAAAAGKDRRSLQRLIRRHQLRSTDVEGLSA
jgi:two-component system, NtrC family, response regulator GlrR